jgi:hypothetical protein
MPQVMHKTRSLYNVDINFLIVEEIIFTINLKGDPFGYLSHFQ